MPDFSFVIWGAADFRLAIVPSHLVVEVGFNLMTVKDATKFLTVVVQVAGPSVARIVGNLFPFSINTPGSTGVSFGSAWIYHWSGVSFEEGSELREVHAVAGVIALKKIS